MPNTVFVRLMAAGAVVSALTVLTATAQPADLRTSFTFTGPVAVPGVTLPAGTYLFRLADTSHRDIIQVFSGDGKRPYSTFFARRARRATASAEPEVRFMETGAGVPGAIRTWWYPGERTGYEFIYPREQARRLARGAAEPILTTVAETTSPAETRTADLARIEPGGETARIIEDTPTLFEPTTPRAIGRIPPLFELPGYTGQTALPETASPLPTLALAGAALLFGAALLRGVRRLCR